VGRWINHQGTWVVVADDHKKGSVTVWTWPEDGLLELRAESGPREGIVAISSATMIPGTDRLAMRCMLTGRIFSVDLALENPEFKRILHAGDLSGDMIFWDSERLIGGTHALAVKQYGAEPPIGILEDLNRLLPDDADHPSSRKVSTHQIKMSRNGDRLILGYVLYPKFLEYRIGEQLRRETHPISFRGYIEPPKKYLETFTNEADNRYFETFHHLNRITWFEGNPIAQFKRGYIDFGTWVSLDDPERLTWDNKARNEMIVAIDGGSVVMATVTETEGGLVQCSLWRRSSFPSP